MVGIVSGSVRLVRVLLDFVKERTVQRTYPKSYQNLVDLIVFAC